MNRPAWDRASLAVVVSLCAIKALVHLLLVSRYGYHGDELYFLESGRHLALEYVALDNQTACRKLRHVLGRRRNLIATGDSDGMCSRSLASRTAPP